MSQGDLNLARRPFVNGRPVTRIAILLFLVGGLLLFYTLYHYLGYVSNTGALRAQLAAVEAQKSQEQKTISQLNERFASLNLARQNEQVDYLNDRITERTFSWSQLFDRLSRLMPSDVRLTRLSPHGVIDTQSDRRRRGAPVPKKKGTDDRVTLVLAGEAKTDAALLQFVDNLFGDPTFIDPDLIQQTREGGKDVIHFDLRVGYLPRGSKPAMPKGSPPAAPMKAGSKAAAPMKAGAKAAAQMQADSTPGAARNQAGSQAQPPPAGVQRPVENLSAAPGTRAAPRGEIRRTPPTFSTPSASATGTVVPRPAPGVGVPGVGVPGVGVPGVVPPPHRSGGAR